jgi:stage IV sporulation protein B
VTKYRFKQLVGLFIAMSFLAIWWFTPIHQLASIPANMRILEGQSAAIDLGLPVTATVSTSNVQVATVHGTQQSQVAFNLKRPILIDSVSQGQADVKVNLFGLIPLKNVHVDVVPELEVIPGGQSIGVKLTSDGIMVVGYNQVTVGEQRFSPGEKDGIKIGDVITEIDGVKIKSTEQAATLINKAGKDNRDLEMKVMRSKQEIRLRVKPVKEKGTDLYRIGLYIRDRAAGVGTLTFYDPKNRIFGALGHVITDVDTGQPITVSDGEIVHSSVTSIDKGESGQPGEKRGIFVDEDQVLGSITKNTDFGVFGKMNKMPDNARITKGLPIALAEQVKEGPAKILTVVEGQKVEEFDIQITNVMKQKFPAIKSMVIKVTDPRLLEKTGGIIQGMSGSPIIQDGKVVGAVTHVFVNDPTQGYGVFIEWMLNEAGIQTKTSSLQKAS